MNTGPENTPSTEPKRLSADQRLREIGENIEQAVRELAEQTKTPSNLNTDLSALRWDEPRNVQDEREITALPFDGAIPWALVEKAEARAPDAPVRDAPGRDFCEETLEELADARNYLVWGIQQLEARGPVAGTSPARARLDQALRSVALSFGLVQRAQQEILEERAA